jgi:hypothetical protein
MNSPLIGVVRHGSLVNLLLATHPNAHRDGSVDFCSTRPVDGARSPATERIV